MPRTYVPRAGVITGSPRVVGNQLLIPVRLDDDPERPTVIAIMIGRTERFYKAFSAALARNSAVRGRLEELEADFSDVIPDDYDPPPVAEPGASASFIY